jgi:hypothetical protein
MTRARLSFILYAQAEDLLRLALRQLGNGHDLVGNLLHIPLMFQLNQGLWRQRDASPKLLSDLAGEDWLAGLIASLRIASLNEATPCPLRDELNQL